MVLTLELRATQDGVIWPRRPLISSKGLLSCVRNLPRSSRDKRPTSFRDVTFNATGEILAATDEKGRIFVFFVTTNRYALVQHLGVPTIACCFSPARKTELLVTCENETARCIDVQSQTLISTLRGHRFPARCASFQKSGKLALTASQDAVILWDTKDWSRYRVLNAGPGVEEATFVSQGDLVAVCFQDDSIMMWELESLALRYRFSLPDREGSPGLRKIAVSENHQVVVASGRAPFIYVWELESQTIVRIIELPAPIKQVVSHIFLPGNSTMVSILGDDGGVIFLDVAATNPQIKLEIAHRDRCITAFDIECHARYLAASTSDGYLLLYDMEIARETVTRVQQQRRKEGLFELEENARLPTRSGLQGSASPSSRGQHVESNQVELDSHDQSRPVPSKLIDSLFGARRGSESKQILDDTVRFSQATTSRSRAGRGSVAHAAEGAGPSVVSIEEIRKERPRASRRKAAFGRVNSLARPPAQLSAQEIEVNRKRLVGSLKCNGMYPKKYRVLVWRFLLRLPKNEEAFRSLVAKGKHPAFMRLKDQYPLQNDRIFRRLHRVLSAITYWCPAFGEVSYLPALVYPFIKIFRENDLAAFEASISVILHWCGDFLVSLPYPPVFAMSALERELEKRDAQLYDHFVQYQVTAEMFAWSLLRTIFTEVLSEDEWMCLWDHLFTFPDTPQLLFVAVLAYLSYFRTALLAASDRFSIEQFFHQQNGIDIQKFIQLMMNMREKMDLTKFTAAEGATETSDSDTGHGPYWPLPSGQYPAFAHYPRFVVDFQISERNRIALEEAELVHKQKLLDQVEEKSKRLKTEHEKWLKEKKLVLAAEEKRRKEAVAAERQRILHLKTLDYETRKRRLEHLNHMEASAHETLEESSKMLQSEYQRLEGTLAMQKERMEFEISSRKQEEDLQRIEFEAQKRIVGIHKRREMEERLSRLRTEFETRVKQQELQDLLKFESWKREDEEQKREAKLQLQRREELAVLHQEKRVRQELENQLVKQQVAKEKELLELETIRSARRQEQQEHDDLDDEIEARKKELSFIREQTQTSSTPRAQEEATSSSKHRPVRVNTRESAIETPERPTASLHRRLFEDSVDSELSGEEEPAHWNAPTVDDKEGRDVDESESPPLTPTKPTTRFVSTPAKQSMPVRPSRRPPSSASSSASFTSAAMRRTMEEMSLLERALGNVSSSASSSGSDGHANEHPGDDNGTDAASVASPTKETSTTLDDVRSALRQNPQQSPAESISTAQRVEPSTPPTAIARDRLRSQEEEPAYVSQFDVPLGADVGGRIGKGDGDVGSSNEEADPDKDEDSFNSRLLDPLQRPIAELEKKLGIRFDEFSDEEKEGDSDNDDGRNVLQRLHESDEEESADEAFEDDRARLLERAKKVLEQESFDTDSDDDYL